MPFLILLLGGLLVAISIYFIFNKSKAATTKLPIAPVNLTLRTYDQVLAELAFGQLFAVVLLSDINDLSIDAIKKHVSKHWPSLPIGKSDIVSEFTRVLEVDKCEIQFEIIAPIELSHCPDSWLIFNHYWPDVSSIIEIHQAAIFVTVKTDTPKLHQSIRLSAVLGALAKTSQSVLGAMWSDRQAISVAALREKCAKQSTTIPTELWVCAHTYVDDQGHSNGYTLGLSDFSETEFEAVKVPENIYDLRSRLESLSRYVLVSGARILNGDTTGVDCMERIKLKKQPSELGRSGWVFQLIYLKASVVDPWRS